MSTSMSELHFRMLMGYFAATSLRVRMVPNLSAGFTEVRNILNKTNKNDATALSRS